MTTINVNPPENISEKDASLFIPYLSYNLPDSRVKFASDIFVCSSGLCMNANGLMKECHHDYPDQYKDYIDDALESYINAIKDKSNLLYLNDNETYLLIHHPWYNYFHWITEAILRLWLVKDLASSMILLLPEAYRQSDFITGSLAPFKLTRYYFIPANKSLYIKNVCIPELKRVVNSYYADMLLQIKYFYHRYIDDENITAFAGERIYVSRRKATRKIISNEEEIEGILLKYGFAIINNEDYTFLKQVSIFRRAKTFVSIHGSGLTNMLFMPSDSRVLELHKKITSDKDWHSFAFWYMADSLGFKYYHQLCEPTNPSEDYFHANLIVDKILFEKNIQLMLSSDIL